MSIKIDTNINYQKVLRIDTLSGLKQSQVDFIYNKFIEGEKAFEEKKFYKAAKAFKATVDFGSKAGLKNYITCLEKIENICADQVSAKEIEIRAAPNDSGLDVEEYSNKKMDVRSAKKKSNQIQELRDFHGEKAKAEHLQKMFTTIKKPHEKRSRYLLKLSKRYEKSHPTLGMFYLKMDAEFYLDPFALLRLKNQYKNCPYTSTIYFLAYKEKSNTKTEEYHNEKMEKIVGAWLEQNKMKAQDCVKVLIHMPESEVKKCVNKGTPLKVSSETKASKPNNDQENQSQIHVETTKQVSSITKPSILKKRNSTPSQSSSNEGKKKSSHKTVKFAEEG